MANPSAVVAAEMTFSRLAQTDGQWTAFRKTADKDAVMFVPQPVNAQAWLKKRADPAAPVKWAPERVYVSCDGGYGASTGPWVRPDGSVGYFTTIWRRQKDGGFKWILDHGDTLTVAPAASEVIEGKIADCARGGGFDGTPHGERPGGKRGKIEVRRIADPPPAQGNGESDDGTLRWRWDVRTDGSRSFTVSIRHDGKDEVVIDDKVKAGGA